jgi:hypothetical protein
MNAVIHDTTVYTNNGALTGLFLVDGCKDFKVSGIEYSGPVLSSPGTLLGYQGATLVRAINGSDDVRVDMRAANCRYGVQTGDYATAATGLCKNLDVKIRGTMIGYPIAAYLADNINVDIDVDGVHRVVYLAGCNTVRGNARYKNQYIAPVACLITDTLTSGSDATAQVAPPANPTTSRGCTDVKLDVTEAGSTTWVADSYVAGISLQRVDPCVFRDIDISVYTTATDTVSTTIHGWIINSVANGVWSRYTNNWESTIVLDNIKVRGTVDKSATTVTVAGGSNGPITLRTDDPSFPTHFATIRNMVIEDFEVRRGTQIYNARLFVRGLATPMVVDRLVGLDPSGNPALYVSLAGNTTQPVIFNGCSFGTLDLSVVPTALATIGPGTVVGAPDADRTIALRGGTLRGAGPRMQTKHITTAALSGASVTLTGAIPAGATDVRVQGNVVTAITGASGFQVGVTGDLTRYADISAVAANTKMQPTNHAASAFTNAGTYTAATDLIITAKTANFTAGVIRLFVTYWEYPSIAS